MMNRHDVDAILILNEIFPDASAQTIFNYYHEFLSSEFNKPEYPIEECLNKYVGWLLYTGRVML